MLGTRWRFSTLEFLPLQFTKRMNVDMGVKYEKHDY